MLNIAGGSYIGGPIPGGTAGSVPFVGIGGVWAQDNPNLSYDPTTKTFTLGILSCTKGGTVTAPGDYQTGFTIKTSTPNGGQRWRQFGSYLGSLVLVPTSGYQNGVKTDAGNIVFTDTVGDHVASIGAYGGSYPTGPRYAGNLGFAVNDESGTTSIWTAGFNQTGCFWVNEEPTSDLSTFYIRSKSPTKAGFVTRLAVSQTADAYQILASDGVTKLAAFDARGGLVPASMADTAAANGTIYYSTTAGKLVYKDAGGTVNNLY